MANSNPNPILPLNGGGQIQSGAASNSNPQTDLPSTQATQPNGQPVPGQVSQEHVNTMPMPSDLPAEQLENLTDKQFEEMMDGIEGAADPKTKEQMRKDNAALVWDIAQNPDPNDLDTMFNESMSQLSPADQKKAYSRVLNIVHPDRWEADPEVTLEDGRTLNMLDHAVQATIKVIGTKNHPQLQGLKLYDIGEDVNTRKELGKALPEHLATWRQTQFMFAIYRLMKDVNTPEATQVIKESNLACQEANTRNNRTPLAGQFNLQALLSWYTDAQCYMARYKVATKNDKVCLMEHLANIHESSVRFCEKYQYPKSFAWPDMDPTHSPGPDKYAVMQDIRGSAEGIDENHLIDWEEAFPDYDLKKLNINAKVFEGYNMDGFNENEFDRHFRLNSNLQPNLPDYNAQPNPPNIYPQSNQRNFSSSIASFALPSHPGRIVKRPGYTVDGSKIVAWIRIGPRKEKGNSYQVIVNKGTDEEPCYEKKTGAQCGGPWVMNHIESCGAQELSGKEEVELLTSQRLKSTFTGILAFVQLNETASLESPKVYCLAVFEDRPPFWMSRTKLQTCLQSKDAIDAVLKRLGAKIVSTEERKQIKSAYNQSQLQLLPAAPQFQYQQAPQLFEPPQPYQLLPETFQPQPRVSQLPQSTQQQVPPLNQQNTSHPMPSTLGSQLPPGFRSYGGQPSSLYRPQTVPQNPYMQSPQPQLPFQSPYNPQLQVAPHQQAPQQGYQPTQSEEYIISRLSQMLLAAR